MRILWLAPYPAWPPTHGGKIRTYNLARRVAASGNTVEMWCISEEDSTEPDVSEPNLSFRFWRQRQRTTRSDKLASALSALPTTAWVMRTPAVLAALREQRGFDLAIVEQSFLGSLVPELEMTGVKWVLDAQNLEWWLTAQFSRRMANPVTRFRLAVDSLKFKRLERRLIQKASAVVAVSPQDADRMRALAGKVAIDVRPNGVDTSYFEFVDHSVPGDANLVMTGTLGYLPNLDAARWLVDDILPRVRSTLPTATLALVGGGVTPELQNLDRPENGVRIVGQVPDVRPHMGAADVFIMPLRVGSGTRLKAVEALASGIPIVATRLAVEGLGLEERGLVLVGETSEALAAAAVRALTDIRLRSRMVHEGRRYAVECFDWDRIASEFLDTLTRAAG